MTVSSSTSSITGGSSADWEARFRAPAIQLSSIARDNPDVGLVTTNASGRSQLYRWSPGTGALDQLTHDPVGRAIGFLSPDGRFVAFLRDKAGNEIGHWVALPTDGGAEIDMTPSMAPYAAESFTYSRFGGLVAFVTASDDRFAVRVGRLVDDGRVADLRIVHHGAASCDDVILSSTGSLAAFSSAHRSTGLEFSVLTVDLGTDEAGPELWDGPGTSVHAFAFSPVRDDARLLATSNATGPERALVWDARTGARLDLPADASDGDIVPLDWSSDGREVLLCRIHAAVQSLLVWNLEANELRELDHPVGAFIGWFRQQASYFHPNGKEIVARWEDFANPRRLIALDRRTGHQTRTLLEAGEVPPGRDFKSIAYASTDGTQIQAWLGVPDGDGPYPVFLETHGGPTAATFANFHPVAQAMLDAGFAVLSINYRGSSSFGRDFEHAIWGQLGECELQDMAGARAWLIENGIARPDKILLTGWSYGGYLTLLGLSRQPELWAGGVAGVAIADWAMSYEDSSDLLRGYQRMLFGGTPEETADAYRTGSPLTYVDDVCAPVLIIQGRNDTRTPARPVEVYVERLRARNHPVEIDWYDAGHTGAGDDLAIEHTHRTIEFARQITELRAS